VIVRTADRNGRHAAAVTLFSIDLHGRRSSERSGAAQETATIQFGHGGILEG